jgi:hypothetical protein
MKTFCQWIKESSPTNSTGGEIRGLGNVSGVPGGTVSSYADFNASDTTVTNAVNAMHAVTNNVSDVKDGNDADTKDNILKVKKK